MKLFTNKTLDNLMLSMQTKLEGLIINGDKCISFRPGSINRLLLAIINSEFQETYKALDEVHIRHLLSEAKDKWLDAVGSIVSCTRLDNEDDDNYRYRIGNSTTELQMCNELSIRTAILSVEGVQDVKFKRYTKGSGSFTAFILTESISINSFILEECTKRVNEVVAYGTKFDIRKPDLLKITLSIKVIFDVTANEDYKNEIRNEIRKKGIEYLNSRNIGEEFNSIHLSQLIKGQSSSIVNFEVINFEINDNKIPFSNYIPRYNEKFIQSSKPDSLSIY